MAVITSHTKYLLYMPWVNPFPLSFLEYSCLFYLPAWYRIDVGSEWAISENPVLWEIAIGQDYEWADRDNDSMECWDNVNVPVGWSILGCFKERWVLGIVYKEVHINHSRLWNAGRLSEREAVIMIAILQREYCTKELRSPPPASDIGVL